LGDVRVLRINVHRCVCNRERGKCVRWDDNMAECAVDAVGSRVGNRKEIKQEM